MRKLEKNHWFASDNSLVISLIDYYAEIKFHLFEGKIVYILRICSENNELFLNFKSLADAVTFTEEVVSKHISLEEITEAYREYGSNKVKKMNRLFDKY